MKLRRRLNIIIFFIAAAILVMMGVLYLITHTISVGVESDYEVVKQRLNIFLFLIVALSAMIVAGVLIIFRLVMGKIIDPIEELSRFPEMMLDGRFEGRLDVRGIEELRVLATNLQKVAHSYKEKADTITKRQKVVRGLAILNELIGFITSEMRFDIIIKNFVDTTKRLIKSGYCAAIAFEPDSFKTKAFVTDEGIQDPLKVSLDPEGFFKIPLKEHLPLRLSHEEASPEGEAGADACHIEIPELNLKVKDILVVPLIFAGRLSGLLLVANKLKGTFDQEDEDMLMNFAFQAFQIITMHEEITNLAITDGLTGLNNHRHFQEKLKEEVEMTKRYGRELSLLILDIDHFKAFNDTYGHQAGDMVLKSIASIISREIRRTDFAARYGGEEFSIILPETGYKGAEILAERIRKKIADTQLFLPDGVKISVTASIGFASIPENTRDKNELIEMADRALYLSKQRGRNMSCGFTEEVYSKDYA